MTPEEVAQKAKAIVGVLTQFQADADGYLTEYHRRRSFITDGPGQPEALLERVLVQISDLKGLLDSLIWAME